MVTVYNLTRFTMTPNPVNAGAGLMIRASFTREMLKWSGAANHKWKDLIKYSWK